MTPEIQAKVFIWRQKAADGTLTLEEQCEAIEVLRAGRVSAAAASDKARSKKAAKIIPDAQSLLDEIGDI